MPVQPVSSTGQPDWSQVTEDILCPLCEYNLRSLSEARCPECGYRFTWPEVLDPQRRLHRYLFEHHPERNVWAFRKTVTGQWLPQRFWRTLHPVQSVNVRRLRWYWLVVALVYFLCVAGIGVTAFVIEVHNLAVFNAKTKAMYLSQAKQGQSPFLMGYRTYDELKAALETIYPTQPRALLRRAVSYHDLTNVLIPALPLAWPWLTMGALLVFRWSMQRARIRPWHVLRCVVYSSDAIFWAGPINLGLYLAWIMLVPSWADPFAYQAVIVLNMAIALHMLYRLVTAYQLYLRFDHPILTILASQVIVGLAMVKLVAFFTIDLG